MKKKKKANKKKASKREQKITREIFVYKEKLSWHYRKKEWKKNQTLHIINMYEKKNTKGLFLQFKIKKSNQILKLTLPNVMNVWKKDLTY